MSMPEIRSEEAEAHCEFNHVPVQINGTQRAMLRSDSEVSMVLRLPGSDDPDRPAVRQQVSCPYQVHYDWHRFSVPTVTSAEAALGSEDYFRAGSQTATGGSGFEG